MNSLDFVICIGLIVYLASYRKKSLVYNLVCSAGFFIGYLVALYLAPEVTKGVDSNLAKGIYALIIVSGLSALFCLGGIYLGSRLRVKVIASNFFKIDKFLAVPYKVIASIAGIILISQSLIFVPVLAVQFVAQGSSILYATSKLVPSSFIQTQSQKIDLGEFSQLHLSYDPDPITFANVDSAGSFQSVVSAASPSIVKVSGINCEGREFGTGFSVGQGLFVTNDHVIAGLSTIYLRDRYGAYPATPILIDPSHDIAVLYSRFLNLPAISLLNSTAPAGLAVAVVGYPLGGNLKLSIGNIGGTSIFEPNPLLSKLNPTNTLTMTALLQPGNSGSPVLDYAGQAVGVANAIDNNSYIAISSTLVNQLVSSAKNHIFPTSTEFCGVFKGY